MISNYIIFGISISVISWVFALMVSGIVKQLGWYEKLGNLNFIQSKTLNALLLVGLVKWMIINTPVKFFNPAIKLDGKGADLQQLRHEMTIAEINHLIGFVFVLAFAVYMSVFKSLLFGFVILMVNVLMNLCPSLIQQENKRRLDRLMQRKQRLSSK